MPHPKSMSWLGVALLLAGLIPAAPAGGEEQSAEEKARLKKLDSGPKTIDVSKYPKEQQEAYKVFVKRCSNCHTIARAINSSFVLPEEWERYIKRMVYKPNSKMSNEDGKAIYRFMVYDSSARKADALRKALEALSQERAAAVEKIKAVNPTFVAP